MLVHVFNLKHVRKKTFVRIGAWVIYLIELFDLFSVLKSFMNNFLRLSYDSETHH